MKKIANYKDTKTLIKVNSQEELDQLIPLLNTIYKGWYIGRYWNDKISVRYIDMTIDGIRNEILPDYEILEASEFITPSVINTYSIF